MKLLNILALALVLILLSPAALAAGDISYDGLARDLVFLPDCDLVPMRLFYGWEALQPGDGITDRVRLSGSLDAGQEMILYMCVDGAGPDEPVLSRLTLEIQGMGGRRVFYGTLEKAAEWIYLGSYTNGEGETLTLHLESPAGPETVYSLEHVNWRFLAVERPSGEAPQSSDSCPQTGDAFPLAWWTSLLLLSGAGLVSLWIMQYLQNHAAPVVVYDGKSFVRRGKYSFSHFDENNR